MQDLAVCEQNNCQYYMGDSEWWDKRFKNRGNEIMSPENQLKQDIDYFSTAKSFLDLACGDGRNSIYLAQMGYEVYGVDFCIEALKRLNLFAKTRKLSIKTRLMDVTSQDELLNFGEKVDVVIVNHYRPIREVYPILSTMLNDNGIIWVNGFTSVPEDNLDVKENDILQDKDFELLINFELLSKENYAIGQRKFKRYIWKKGEQSCKQVR